MTSTEALALRKWRELKDTVTIAAEMRAAGLRIDEAWVCKTIAAEQNRIYRARELARCRA